jgi:hypothetical protein
MSAQFSYGNDPGVRESSGVQEEKNYAAALLSLSLARAVKFQKKRRKTFSPSAKREKWERSEGGVDTEKES